MACYPTGEMTEHRAIADHPLVAILTGSPNDLPVVHKACDTLDALGVPWDLRVLSAHRTPDAVPTYVRRAEEAGVEVFVACAGLAAHLGGVVAGHTLRPVVGVPLSGGALRGFDALLSTVQMPPGVPVATVGVDNARNAALLAAQILAVRHPTLRERLGRLREEARSRYDEPDPGVPPRDRGED